MGLKSRKIGDWMKVLHHFTLQGSQRTSLAACLQYSVPPSFQVLVDPEVAIDFMTLVSVMTKFIDICPYADSDDFEVEEFGPFQEAK